MNFSTISQQTLIGKLLRLALAVIPVETKLPILQGKLKGKRWIVGSSNHGCWIGSYEYKKRLLFEQLVEPGSIVYDIGAHVGFYTLLSAVLVGPTGRVIAFEPLPRNLCFLKEHLRLNAITNVTVIEAAVSDCTGIAQFSGPGSATGRISAQGELAVKTVKLDDLRCDLPPPNCIKMDIEGGELAALQGGQALLSEHRYDNFPGLLIAENCIHSAVPCSLA